jgi:1-pyrroline-5-carboxylate dehydrogenase
MDETISRITSHGNHPEEVEMDAVTQVPVPRNEPVHSYAPGSPERAALEARLKELAAEPLELPITVGGDHRLAGGEPIAVTQPHRRQALLGRMANATAADVRAAVAAAKEAAPGWRGLPFEARAAVLLKAADLLAGPWRATLNAASMLGQSKTCYQAEIDAACELIDFWRFNVAYAAQILREQPESARGTWNQMDHRPLEGFVVAITPFNFTSIAGNLPTAPALMGNTVVWKPSPTQQLAGVQFTGSTATFKLLWRTVAEHLDGYRGYPRLVGETGGKDFVIAHPSADPAALKTALVRGAFEYQGQKCSAASRAYVPPVGVVAAA